MSWTYKGVVFTDEHIPEGAIGFIYRMSAIIDGKLCCYIGKKNFRSNRKKALSKKKQSKDKRKKKYERVIKSDYQNYYSSNETLKKAHEDKISIKRDILYICFSKKDLTYQEVKHQFNLNVLEDNMYLNGNILGRFFKQIS